ncbi:MAG: glycosyltransferase [Synergistaceae bacterium]|nr:glycosyltransferase [Synergistaceae bacterium]
MLPKDFYENVPSRCVKECGLNADDIFISIAIPTYKRTDLLEQAINSALNQDVTGGGGKV